MGGGYDGVSDFQATWRRKLRSTASRVVSRARPLCRLEPLAVCLSLQGEGDRSAV
jgi:hypothetical protein